MSEYDRKIWQEEQAVRDAALDVQRGKWAKAKARAAKNAQRKLQRLSRKLSETGELTDWEEEFASSVTERLDKFGSAFQDREKGRPADALSFAQKKVVAALNKKAKGKKADTEKPAPGKARSSFKNKGGFGKKAYQPRVRQIEEDLPDEEVLDSSEPFLPEFSGGPKKPFLRIVK